MNRQILRLAIPNIISNLSIPLLSTVDTALMGHLGSENYLGGIALGTAIFNVLYWGFGFLRMGTTGLTAQAFGAKNIPEQSSILARGLAVAMIGSLLIILFQYSILDFAMFLMDGNDSVKSIAANYYTIRIWGAPAAIGLIVMVGWFLGMQNARIAMVITIVVNLSNIALSVLFVQYFDMQERGVAYGTVIAQYAGILVGGIIFLRQFFPSITFEPIKSIFSWEKIKVFWTINLDIIIRTFCIILVLNYVVARSSSVGEEFLPVNALLLLLLTLMSYGVDGFAFAAESLTGKYYGSGEIEKLKMSIRKLLQWGLGCGLGYGFIYLIFGKQILGLLTDQEVVINNAVPYVYWIAAISIAGGIAFTWDGIYLGVSATKPMRNVLLIAAFAVFFPVWYFTKEWGNHGLWLGVLLFMVTRALGLHLLAKKSVYPN